MPRNGSGTASIPNSFSPSTTIASSSMNANFTDVASMLTASLAIDGQSAMTGQLKAADGTASAPGLGFASDSNTGFRRSASGTVKYVADGTDVATFSATGLAVVGTITDSSGSGLIPSGVIVMWSGSVATVPSGWYLCNGSNGTPDLRNKFIIGAHSDDSGTAKTTITGSATQSGGSKDAIAVSHTHTATSTVTDPGHDHAGVSTTRGGNGGSGSNILAAGDAYTTTPYTPDVSPATTGITVDTTIASTGSSGTNANLPPYYALAFIMKA